jgi:ATP-dependent Clp protease ATP-binding subunit ClpX
MKDLSQQGIYRYLDSIASGQEDAKKALSYIGFMHMTKSKVKDLTQKEVPFKKSNALLMGPTGCGKTHLARALGEYLDLPFIEVDGATMTPTGYVGEDMASVISKEIASKYRNNPQEAYDRSIIFIDEIDKLCIPASSTQGDFNAQKQDDILKLVEGKTIRSGSPKIDTTSCLFILAGSFAHLGRNKTRKSMGFTNKLEESYESQQLSLHKAVMKGGMKPELAGRISLIAELSELNKDDLKKAFMEVSNNIYSQYQELFKHTTQKTLELSEEEIESILERCIENGTGARGLQTELDTVLYSKQLNLEFKFDLPEVFDITQKPLDVKDLKLKREAEDNKIYEQELDELLRRFTQIV